MKGVSKRPFRGRVPASFPAPSGLGVDDVLGARGAGVAGRVGLGGRDHVGAGGADRGGERSGPRAGGAGGGAALVAA